MVDEASTATEFEVQSLQPFSTCTCCVMAITSVGSTPTACQTTQTMEDSKYYWSFPFMKKIVALSSVLCI